MAPPRRVRDRFVRKGLLKEDATNNEVAAAVYGVNNRLRIALGEYG